MRDESIELFSNASKIIEIPTEMSHRSWSHLNSNQYKQQIYIISSNKNTCFECVYHCYQCDKKVKYTHERLMFLLYFKLLFNKTYPSISMKHL